MKNSQNCFHSKKSNSNIEYKKVRKRDSRYYPIKEAELCEDSNYLLPSLNKRFYKMH